MLDSRDESLVNRSDVDIDVLSYDAGDRDVNEIAANERY
jgi:hypothetical protein